MKVFILPFLSLLFLFSCDGISNKEKKSTEQPYLIILSLDGFRWDYPDKAITPTLDSLAKIGVKAESMKPSFPTKTFPNHYSIATGLVPDHHGLVLNQFYATDLDKPYSISNRDAVTDGEFYGGEPMWNVAESQGLKTATLFWVGASAEVNKKRPSYWSTYVSGLSLDSRIDSLSNWLSLPEAQRPHLIMWYYLEPDWTGHDYGPNSPELVAEVEKLDAFISDFFTAMRKLPDFDKLNFIILSDHGMAELSPEKVILLDDLIDTNDLDIWDGGNPVMNLKVKPGKIDKVFNELNGSHAHLNAWKHGEIPVELNYGNNLRTHDITIASDSGWSFYWSWKQGTSLATHGFSNNCKDMHAIFYAAGPVFKKDYVQPTFNNVDVYPLAGEILNLKMPDSDGDLDNIKGILNE